MKLSLNALAMLMITLSVGCSQAASPSSPTAVGSNSTKMTSDEIAAHAGATHEVPFKGRLEGTFTFAPDPPPSPFATVHLEATGLATELGRFTIEAPHRVYLGGPITATGTMEFTAANGDRLKADFIGTATPTSPTGVSIVETATISGGTGRFTSASGTVVLTRDADLAALSTTGSFDGTISLRP
jgi:hypothetical protein